MSYNIDDWKGLDFTKINEYTDDLTMLPDYIPQYIIMNSGIDLNKRNEYLKKEGILEKIQKKVSTNNNLAKILPYKIMRKILMNECIKFIKNYPEYEDMIMFIERRK